MDKKVAVKIIAVIVAAVVAIVALLGTVIAVQSCNSVADYHITKRMEKLDRGLVAFRQPGRTYLSWRLLGDESLENQSFDIYRDGVKIHTTDPHSPTNYYDNDVDGASAEATYRVVKAGESPANEKATSVWTTEMGWPQTNLNSENSAGYLDLTFEYPEPDARIDNDGNPVLGDDGEQITYAYGANDTCVGDLDGDGDYELVVLMLACQNGNMNGYSSPAYLFGLDVDWNTGATQNLWEIYLGRNVTAGPHYSCFLVYDLDGDNKAEVMMKTSAGSKGGDGKYVSEVGVTEDIKNTDNQKLWFNLNEGKNMIGPEFLTIFNGQTGAAMQTVNYDPPTGYIDWGDNFDNRSGRYNCTVAYLDGENPYAVFNRGIYTSCFYTAYSWDGRNLTRYWFSENYTDGTCKVTYADGSVVTENKSVAWQGNHNFMVADMDNDGKDEIVIGAAVVDHDGTPLYSTGRGHGDAMHVTDFDNDGKTEVYSVHESVVQPAMDIVRYDGKKDTFQDIYVGVPAGVDVGRGIMANLDDEYAYNHPEAASMYYTSLANGIFNMKGEWVCNSPYHNGQNFQNATVYWDGDLGSELLDGNMLAKQVVKEDTAWTTRFYWGKSDSYMPNCGSNNSTKKNACLTADILGDWREEILVPLYTGGIRVYVSGLWTDYRLTTLMHDGQYRCQVTSECSGYNQPPHPSYYIGSLALAKDSGGNLLNYLAPKKGFDKVKFN